MANEATSPRHAQRLGLVGTAAVIAGTTALHLAAKTPTSPAAFVAPWLPGALLTLLGLVLFALARRALPPPATPSPTPFPWRPLLVLTALAALTRLYRLDAVPPGLWLDETDIAKQALEILQGARPYPWEVARLEVPWLYHYYVALWYRLLGPGYLAVKAPHVVISILTAPALYLLAREWLSPPAAFLATALWATMRWSVNMSRWGHANTLTLFWFCVVLWLLWRAQATNRPLYWVLGGIALGLSQYGYQATRALVPLVALFLLYRAFHPRGYLRPAYGNVLLFWLAFAAVYAPLAWTYLHHPNLFLERSRAISIFNPLFTRDPWATLVANIGKYLGMFHYVGDPNGRHNIPGWPVVDPITGVLLVLGLAAILAFPRRPAHVLLLLWLGAFLTAGILTTEAPNTFRVYGLTPALALLVGAALEALVHLYGRPSPASWRTWSLPALAVVLAALLNVTTFFTRQATDPGVVGMFNVGPTRVGQYIATLPSDVTVYLDREFWAFSPIEVINPGRPLTRLKTPDHVPPPPDQTGEVVYILGTYGRRLLPLLQRLYPSARVHTDTGPTGAHVFTAVRVPAPDVARRGLRGRWHAEEGSVVDTITLPTHPPFRRGKGILSGGLYVPRPGPYRLMARGILTATVTFPHRRLTLEEGRPVTVTLPGGLVPLRVQLTYRAPPTFFWQGPDAEEMAPIPPAAWYPLDLPMGGLLALWFEGGGFRKPPVRVSHASILYADNAGDLATAAMRWLGEIRIERTGVYTFGLSSDDGSRLWIDGRLVVDNWGLHGAGWVEGSVRLTRGRHRVRIDFVDNGGSYWFEWRWTPPGGRPGPVPPEVLAWTSYDIKTALQPPPEPPPVLRVVDADGRVQGYVPVATYDLRDPQFNRPVGDANFQGWPMKVHNAMYDHGIGVYGPGELTFRLDGRFRRFRGLVGVDMDTYGDAHVRVQIWGDDRLLWESDVLRTWDPPQAFDVDVSGVQVLRLRQIEAGLFEGRGDGVDWIAPTLVP